MVHEDWTPMTAGQAMAWFEENSSEIDRRFQLLRKSKTPRHPDDEALFTNVPITPPSSSPHISVATALDTLPWTSLLGRVDFEDLTSKNANNPDVPELRWRSKPAAHLQHKLGKRQSHEVIDRLAMHDIRGRMNALEAMGLIG